MGVQAVRLFDEAGALGGIRGKARLAAISRITSTEAELADDSTDLIGRLIDALALVRLELAHVVPTRTGRALAEETSAGELRRHLQTFLELMTQRSLFLGELDLTVRRINEASAHALNVDRVSTWVVDENFQSIRCLDLFERNANTHSSGMELLAEDFPEYFRALRDERTIAAHDAHTDPRTSCFSKPYLTPHGIGAMLDVPIWSEQHGIGVLCHEHVGGARKWTADEERFAYLLGSLVALAWERRRDRADKGKSLNGRSARP